MTETELTDRLREAIVLDGPDAWRANGYLQDAQTAGLTLEAALKRANAVGAEVTNNSILFDNIKARIARLADPARSLYIETDLNQIINAARSLNLSADFVRERWVPVELARLKQASAPPAPVSPPPAVAPTPIAPADKSDSFADFIESPSIPPGPENLEPEPVVVPPQTPEPIAAQPTPVVPVRAPEPAYSMSEDVGPPPVVRKFTATPGRVRRGETVTLEWEVDNLLAVTIDDLGEGLSPKNRGWIKPKKSADYTLFDANDNPLSTVRIEVIPPDRSGVYGVLFALALLALIYWFIKSSNVPSNDAKPKRRTEQTSQRRTETSTCEPPIPGRNRRDDRSNRPARRNAGTRTIPTCRRAPPPKQNPSWH